MPTAVDSLFNYFNIRYSILFLSLYLLNPGSNATSLQVNLSLSNWGQCHEDVGENGVIVPCSLNLALIQMSGQIHSVVTSLPVVEQSHSLGVCLSVHLCICVEKKNQLDVTECFIALMIRSARFGHFYAHHQELETICVLLPPMVCGAWLHDLSCNIPLPGRIACCTAPDPRHPATKHCTP